MDILTTNRFCQATLLPPHGIAIGTSASYTQGMRAKGEEPIIFHGKSHFRPHNEMNPL